MNAKTMEGLVGARTNINLRETPMRVFREARRKGDRATMERALGYAGECSDRAKEYKAKADKGMEEDAKQAREKAKIQREEAIQKRREEREKLEEKVKENGNTDTGETDACFVEISEEGKVLQKDNIDSGSTGSGGKTADTAKEPAREPIIYTKTGEAVPAEAGANISVSV
ncbi:MAG: hypothetical protein K2O03_15830 [Lachnospiraceae bacterium]|nr:hypothetical protein [Lachnospiraceae bacterium]